ncbi:MarR family transcriptional regulator [Streptomyces collinus]|uniref:MarR family transcriptional regulator n=1 Tax=Streptomyces collinus TaxID=42684 RepID=UPI003649B357
MLIVASDIAARPDSAVGEIAGRAGLPQSQASVAIARLKETRSVQTVPDADDRRRALVRLAAEVSERVPRSAPPGSRTLLPRSSALTSRRV